MVKDFWLVKRKLSKFIEENSSGGIMNISDAKDMLEAVETLERSFVLSCKFISDSVFCPAADSDIDIPVCDKNPGQCAYEVSKECWQQYFIKFASYKPESCTKCCFFTGSFRGYFCKIFEPRYFLFEAHAKTFEAHIKKNRAAGCPLDYDYTLKEDECCPLCNSMSLKKNDKSKNYCTTCHYNEDI